MKRSQEAVHIQEAAPMEQVRELLFGAQLKDMETRFQRQEERLLREIGNVRDDLKSRLDSLENFMKSETGSLLHHLQEEETERAEALKSEQRERAEAVKAEQRERAEGLVQAAKELAVTVEAFDRKIAKISGSLDAAERELRTLLMAESNALSSKVEERYQNALHVLAETSSQIRHDMVYRSSLSGMFTEVAIKLNGQWTVDMGLLTAGESVTADGDNDDASHGA